MPSSAFRMPSPHSHACRDKDTQKLDQVILLLENHEGPAFQQLSLIRDNEISLGTSVCILTLAWIIKQPTGGRRMP